jgi:hypothetical protein
MLNGENNSSVRPNPPGEGVGAANGNGLAEAKRLLATLGVVAVDIELQLHAGTAVSQSGDPARLERWCR